jgi:hypothetical protein
MQELVVVGKGLYVDWTNLRGKLGSGVGNAPAPGLGPQGVESGPVVPPLRIRQAAYLAAQDQARSASVEPVDTHLHWRGGTGTIALAVHRHSCSCSLLILAAVQCSKMRLCQGGLCRSVGVALSSRSVNRVECACAVSNARVSVSTRRCKAKNCVALLLNCNYD